MKEAVKRIEAAALKANIPLGGVAFRKEATEAIMARGSRMAGGFDALWLKGAIARSRSWLAGNPS